MTPQRPWEIGGMLSDWLERAVCSAISAKSGTVIDPDSRRLLRLSQLTFPDRAGQTLAHLSDGSHFILGIVADVAMARLARRFPDHPPASFAGSTVEVRKGHFAILPGGEEGGVSVVLCLEVFEVVGLLGEPGGLGRRNVKKNEDGKERFIMNSERVQEAVRGYLLTSWNDDSLAPEDLAALDTLCSQYTAVDHGSIDGFSESDCIIPEDQVRKIQRLLGENDGVDWPGEGGEVALDVLKSTPPRSSHNIGDDGVDDVSEGTQPHIPQLTQPHSESSDCNDSGRDAHDILVKIVESTKAHDSTLIISELDSIANENAFNVDTIEPVKKPKLTTKKKCGSIDFSKWLF